MALRKVFEGRHRSRKVKVFRDPLWDEYVAKLYRLNPSDGTWGCTGEYRTGDKRDALLTGSAMLLEGSRNSTMKRKAASRPGVLLSTKG